MITIEKVRLDIQAERKEFATRLYGRWDSFCRTSVEKVMDDTLSVYDGTDEVIRVGKLTVELGCLPEDGFYERFPQVLSEKLKEIFTDCLRERGKYPVEVISLRQDRLEVLLFFLLYGRFPQGTASEIQELGELLRMVISENGEELVRRLRGMGEIAVVGRRLGMQFENGDLELVVELAEPAESVFIKLYIRYLIVTHQHLGHPEITAGDYRIVVWEVVFAYLLYEGRSFFSRKQLVVQTVKELAAHFNLDYLYLLQLLTSGLVQFMEEWVFVPELLAILANIRAELPGEHPDLEQLVPAITDGTAFTEENRKALLQLLANPATCHKILLPLREEEIEKLAAWIVPAESAFIISYARGLEREKQRGMLEGKAGAEFRILKWEFIFLVLLALPRVSFQRCHFVRTVVYRLAVHYNLEPDVLLAYLWVDLELLPVALAEILRELYEERKALWIKQLAEINPESACTRAEREHLFWLLSHPVTARHFLVSQTEKQIQRIVKIVIPQEGDFVIQYALALDRERGRGMLEGHAGPEFRVLKWEFIFGVLLSAPMAAFERKQFVRSVLYGIAAHYNLWVGCLLDYFYRVIIGEKSSIPENVSAVIREIWKEERMPVLRHQEGRMDRKAFEEIFQLLCHCPEVIVQRGQDLGTAFILQLLSYSMESGKAAFIRENKERIWHCLFANPAGLRKVYEQLSDWEGVFPMLAGLYGRRRLLEILIRAGMKGPCWLKGQEFIRLDDIRQLPDLEIDRWLRNDGAALAGLWNKAPEDEVGLMVRKLAGNPELGLLWIRQLGSIPLQAIVVELQELGCRVFSFPAEEIWLAWLLPFTREGCMDYSYTEIWMKVWGLLKECVSENERIKIAYEMRKNMPRLAGLKKWLFATEDENTTFIPKVKREEVVQYVTGNAGLVILGPYLPRLFALLDYTGKGVFAGPDAQIRAVFLLQRLLYDEGEYEEPDLILNKLLTGWRLEEPVPREMELNQEEKELADSLLKGIMQNWEKMKNTSVQGFRESFLIRSGILQETGACWQLTVEERGYDILLDSLPWTFSPVKFPWMEKPLYVHWK